MAYFLYNMMLYRWLMNVVDDRKYSKDLSFYRELYNKGSFIKVVQGMKNPFSRFFGLVKRKSRKFRNKWRNQSRSAELEEMVENEEIKKIPIDQYYS